MSQPELADSLPPNKLPGVLSSLLFLMVLCFFTWSLIRAGFSFTELWQGLPNMAVIIGEMVPPATDRFLPMLNSILVTFQMALVGTALGVLLSLPLALLAARNTTPSPLIRHLTRSLISFFRTVPDLAWALFFVASVGLGPFAGTLALLVDTIGFCGRFFAETIEEVDDGPDQALTAIGVRSSDRIAVAILPSALPGLTASGLFALEKAVRSSVVLGLVGAGGIGAELAVSMEMFRYDQAATIILMIFVLVLAVEQISSKTRSNLLNQSRKNV